MTTYLVNALLVMLMLVLFGRKLVGWLKERKIWLKIAIPVLILAFSAVDIFFLTLFETLFCMVIILIVFLFRKDIFGFLKRVSGKKLGKLMATGCVLIGVFGIWLSLAVFYRTDIGMPIGVKNYLYHKYNEEFDVNGFMGVKIKGSSTNKLTCCPKKGNPATDSFNVERKKNLSIGSRRFASDNYYGIIIREDYEKFISEILSEYFDEFQLYVNFNWSGLSNVKYMSDHLDKSTSLDEFLKFQKESGESCNIVTIENFVPENCRNDKSQYISEIAEKLKNYSGGIIMYIFYCDENGKSSGYTDIQINNKGNIYIYEY